MKKICPLANVYIEMKIETHDIKMIHHFCILDGKIFADLNTRSKYAYLYIYITKAFLQ